MLATEPATDRCYLLVGRYPGQANWVLKQDGGYQLFQLKRGDDQVKPVSLDRNQVVPASSNITSIISHLDARFIDVDRLKRVFPKVGVLVLDNEKTAFFIDMQGTNSITPAAYFAFRFGALVRDRELSFQEIREITGDKITQPDFAPETSGNTERRN